MSSSDSDTVLMKQA